MYMHGLSDAMTDAGGDYTNTSGNDVFATDTGAFEAGYTESPSNYQAPMTGSGDSSTLPNIGTNAGNAAQGGSPSWSSLTQSALSTYKATREAKAAETVAQAQAQSQRSAVTPYRYPVQRGYSPFPSSQPGSGPTGLNMTVILALAALGVGAVILTK